MGGNDISELCSNPHGGALARPLRGGRDYIGREGYIQMVPTVLKWENALIMFDIFPQICPCLTYICFCEIELTFCTGQTKWKVEHKTPHSLASLSS